MARTRTTPEATPDITKDLIMAFGVTMAYNADGSPNPDGIRFDYVVNNVSDTGDVIKSVRRQIAFADWPAAVKTDLKAIYAKILIDAENRGLIGAGTDSDDLA